MYPQGVCRIRKPACAGNGCAIFPAFEPARIGKKIRYPAADDLFRGSLAPYIQTQPRKGKFPLPRLRFWHFVYLAGCRMSCK